MKEFFDELRSADSIGEVLLRHRKETVKIALLAVLVMAALLVFVYRGGSELELTDAAETTGSETADAYDTGRGASGQEEGASAGAQGSGPAVVQGSGSEDAPETVPAGSNADGADAAGTGTAGSDGTGVPVGSAQIYVDIGGAVKEPKLAVLPQGSRVEDAILQAGGTTEDADLAGINRAALLNDGDKIYIPKQGEAAAPGSNSVTSASGGSGQTAGSAGSSAGSGSEDGKISINTADAGQLQQITGVGPVTAQKIVDYRNANGPFSAVEDLKNVSGIGDKTFEKMKGDITL